MALKAGPRVPPWLVFVIAVATLGILCYLGYSYWFEKIPHVPPPPS